MISMLFMVFASAAASLSGNYNCNIQYEEFVDIHIQDGEEFPEFGANLESPRVRIEVLKLNFTNSGVRVENPEVLPNFLLINPSQYTNQNSFANGNHYQIDWPHTWYFGSTMIIEVLAVQTDSVALNITFDDNDGWSQLIKNVQCLR